MTVLYLIDVSGFVFRAFYALPALTSPEGVPVGAVFGFCNMLMKLRREITRAVKGTGNDGGPASVLWVAVVDVARKTFRNDIFPAYKSNRKQVPEELVAQFPVVHDACAAFGCPVKGMSNFEADDVIASYAKKAETRGFDSIIVSSDKDFMQLCRPGVSIFDPIKSVFISSEHIHEKFGVPADKVTDVQALAGDPTDGVFGAPGVGIKTAAGLIKQFGSLDVLLHNVFAIPSKRQRDIIARNVDNIRIAKQLVTLRDDVDVEFDEEELTFSAKLNSVEINRISAFYNKWGFSRFHVGANKSG
ncbi:MAG: hypothetical protein LBF66_01295 [Holosporales bacterium]|jgi:DNA polymerase-1|nr:hypothetical protein [Holosporales bacterium]